MPNTAALLCFVIGAVDVLSVLLPAWDARLAWVGRLLPGAFLVAAGTATVIIGMLLLLLSHALRRRKRRAWRAVVALLALSVVFHLFRGLYVAPALVATAMLAVLIVYRAEFYAVGDPRTRWRALGAFSVMTAVGMAVGLAYLAINAHHLVTDYSLMQRVEHVVLGMVGVSGPVRFADQHHTDVLDALTSAFGVTIALVTVHLIFRPARPAPTLDATDEQAMRGLLDRHGRRDSLGYFALRRDKSVIWSPTGKACIAYRVVSGVILASGDPLGDPEAWPGAIHAFLHEAAAHAWVPAVMGCSELGGQVWTREGGLSALELGDEAIINTAEFTLAGRAMRNVRQMVTRVERNGYTATVRRLRDVPAGELAELRAQAERWLGGETERGFSMALGRIGADGDEDCVVATAHRGGKVCAFLHFVPWGPDGLSLDQMRRDRSAAPGLNEFLIARAIQAAPDLGISRVSLNFAVFRSALERGERLGAGPVTRAWRAVLVFMSRWYQIESLYRFNAKFQPHWQTRFVVFPNTRDTPRIGIAALQAEAFITRPHLNPHHDESTPGGSGGFAAFAPGTGVVRRLHRIWHAGLARFVQLATA